MLRLLAPVAAAALIAAPVFAQGNSMMAAPAAKSKMSTGHMAKKSSHKKMAKHSGSMMSTTK